MRLYTSVIILVLVAACCSMPAMGATKYLGGNPEMSAYISGLNEFNPGEETTISVTIQNSGTHDMKFTNSGVLQAEDLATTAKELTVGLAAGGAPLIIKADPQMAGDLKSPNRVTIRFNAKILSNATIGEYQIPLMLEYKFLKVQDQEVSDTLEFAYNDVTETLPLTINIKPRVRIAVLDAVTENLNVGTEGYLNLTIKNNGAEAGKRATVKILRNGNSPVIPTDSMVYVGEFPVNGVVNCRYKVAISTDAESQAYPVDVVVSYENTEGDAVTSVPETIGVPVGDKIGFSMSSPPPTLSPGKSAVIEIVYRNTGNSTAYNAQARLNAVDPFVCTDNGAYLGDIPSGGQATARYALSASDQAEPKTYSLDTEIRYRDSLDNSQISDKFTTDIQVVATQDSGSVMGMLPVLVVIVLVVAGAGYYLFVMRKKK